MNLVGRIRDILLKPGIEWHIIARESVTASGLYKKYIALLAAIGPVASVIGMSFVGVNLPNIGTLKISVVSAIANAVSYYILTMAGVYALALTVYLLAPVFSGEKNFKQAFKIAAYSYTPLWLAGIFMVVPSLNILRIAGLYGIYMIYSGLPVLMKPSNGKLAGYTSAAGVAAIIIFAAINMISRVLFTYPRAGILGI